MPRGSDSEAAGAELKARTGLTPNAEEMIKANQEQITPELRAASNRPIDYEATKEMDEDEAKGFLEEEGHEVVSFAVRGPFVVVVAEDEYGHLHKTAHARKGKEKQAERATQGSEPRGGLRGKVERHEEKREEKREARTTSRRTASGPSTTTE